MDDDTGEISFQALLGRERRLRERRRKRLRLDPEAPVAALALSGGGIRSATFSLGVLQALSARALSGRFDYLSTVSGGSYIGSFFGALFVPPEGRGGSPADQARARAASDAAFDPFRPLQSPLGIEAVRRLRDSGRYLTPSGTSDAFFGAAIVMRNWAAVQLVIGLVALALFWLLRVADPWISPPAYLPSAFSPTLGWLLMAALAFTFGPGTAYWLTRREIIPANRVIRTVSNMFFWSVVALFLYTTTPAWGWFNDAAWLPQVAFAQIVGVVTAVALGAYLYAEGKRGAVAQQPGREDRQRLIAAEDRVRTWLSDLMARGLTMSLILAALALIDLAGWALLDAAGKFVRAMRGGDAWDVVVRAWPALVAAAPPVLSWLASVGLKRERPGDEAKPRRNWGPALLVIGGSLILILWLTIWSAASYYGKDHVTGWVALVLLLVVNFIVSISFSFINLSSLSIFYAARLRRAYIGASSNGRPFTSVRRDDPQDAIRLQDYYGYGIDAGAPLHIINVTIAETMAEGSNIVARDRKGKPMQVLPGGVAYEGVQPGKTIVRNRRWGEELPLANWVAVSGAAVAAAIGSGTTLGTSILATMANVRLGYWWKVDIASRPGIVWRSLRETVQNHLLLELRGAFSGEKDRVRWYLTDGGHFDNSGVYPLLQRRARFIMVCDNGADPDYRMADVVRLVGRARSDLGVGITFLSKADLTAKLGAGSPLKGVIGPYGALARKGSKVDPGGPIATLARIDYGPREQGLLMIVKPRLTFDEPPELLAYAEEVACADFPQQTTGDQFFDEEQWEAYRRLGEIAGRSLFRARPAGWTGWMPIDELARDVEGETTPVPSPARGWRDRLLGRG